MKFSKKMLITVAALPLLAGLGGCASKMIGERVGADLVELKEASQVSSCKNLGKLHVSVLAEVGFITRRPEDVEANLLQMARNGAVDKGGDTVVKGSSGEYGKRTFDIYKCQP